MGIFRNSLSLSLSPFSPKCLNQETNTNIKTRTDPLGVIFKRKEVDFKNPHIPFLFIKHQFLMHVGLVNTFFCSHSHLSKRYNFTYFSVPFPAYFSSALPALFEEEFQFLSYSLLSTASWHRSPHTCASLLFLVSSSSNQLETYCLPPCSKSQFL